MNEKDSVVEIYFCYYTMFIWFIWSVTILLSGRIRVKGAVLEGWLLYGFIILMNMIFLFQGNSIPEYLIKKNNGKVTRKILFLEFIKSPFFIMFLIMLVYQNFSFKYFNIYILFMLYIPFFYSQYVYLKKMENYGNK